MKKILITLVVMVASSMAGMAAGNYLHVKTSEGWSVLDLDQVDRLSFSGNVMTATSATGEIVASYPQDQLEKMVGSDVAGVQDLTVGSQAKNFVFDGVKVTIQADGNFAVYNTEGTVLVEIADVRNGEKIDLSALTPGVYVAKSGNQSQKIVVK